MSKKQNYISLSTTEAEYIAACSYCTQLLWMQKLLRDYGICQKHLTIFCDNTSAINISKIRFNILKLNTQRFDITSLGSLSKMVLLLLSLFTLMIKRLICLSNLLTANNLNSFSKTLVSSLLIDLFFSSFFPIHLHLVLSIALLNLFLFVFFSVLVYFVFHIKIKI